MLANHEALKKITSCDLQVQLKPSTEGAQGPGDLAQPSLVLCCESRRGVKYQTSSTKPA